MISFFKEFTISKKKMSEYTHNTVSLCAMSYVSMEEEVFNSSIKFKVLRGRNLLSGDLRDKE